MTAFYVDRALREIGAAASREQPFYINLWLDDVHTPLQPPSGNRGDGSRSARYAGVMKEMDRQLGRLFEFIRSEPKLRETMLILLASNNGPENGCGSSGGLRGDKGRLYEGGIRSPLVVWGGAIPRAAVGSENDTTVLAAMDLPPSLLALAGVQPPSGVPFDGMNMADALVGRAMPTREQPVFWTRPPDRPGPNNRWPDLAIRDGDWKLLMADDGERSDQHSEADWQQRSDRHWPH